MLLGADGVTFCRGRYEPFMGGRISILRAHREARTTWALATSISGRCSNRVGWLDIGARFLADQNVRLWLLADNY